MARFFKYVLIGVACAALLGIFAIAGISALWWWGLTHETVRQTDAPVSLEKAAGKCPIALPAEARNIQYYLRAGGLQSYHAKVRFEAPVEVCRAWAGKLYDKYEARSKHRRPGFRPIIFVPSHANNASEPPWFDPGSIVHGILAGSNSSHEPQIWIDENRGVFYCSIDD